MMFLSHSAAALHNTCNHLISSLFDSFFSYCIASSCSKIFFFDFAALIGKKYLFLLNVDIRVYIAAFLVF